MNEDQNTQHEEMPIPILGITTTGQVLIPSGLRQVEILTLMQVLQNAVKKTLDNLVVP